MIKITVSRDDDVQGTLELPNRLEMFVGLTIKMLETVNIKNNDYTGESSDVLKNFRGGGLKGIINRMGDKFMRLTHIVKTQKMSVQTESFYDTCLDLANYCVILCIASDTLSVEGDLWND